MNKTFEEKLPEGYHRAMTVDAANGQIGIYLNIAALVVMAVVLYPAWRILQPKLEEVSFVTCVLFLICMAGYIVCHELVHGLVYKLLTHRKLKFGITLTAAFCGVPDIYVYRRTALMALLAPFVVFTFVFGLPLLLLPGALTRFLCAVLLGLHWGGCAGDLYDTWLYLTKFRDPATLMNDTGPLQTFYLPE